MRIVCTTEDPSLSIDEHPERRRGRALRRPALPLEWSRGTTLAQDCAWADTVVDCDTIAMVVALHAGRRVVSVIPPGG